MNSATKTKKTSKAIVPSFASEHVSLPGFPQVIVTRHFCYQFMIQFDLDKTGFGSADWYAWGRPSTALPLTAESERDAIAAMITTSLKATA